MPSTARSTRVRTLSRPEQRFLERYVREGATEDRIAAAERLAHVKVGDGVKMLRLAHVQDELKRRMEPVRIEQMRQQMLADAVAQVTANIQESHDRLKAEMSAILSVPKMQVQEDVLEHELMRLVVGLDQDKHPGVKLEAIKAAFVVKGTLENGTTRRVTPPERGEGPGIPGMYRSLFDRKRAELEAAPVIEAAVPQQPPFDEDQIFDLVPQDKPAKAAEVPLPAAGEEIEAISLDPAPRPQQKAVKGKREVITVEIG